MYDFRLFQAYFTSQYCSNISELCVPALRCRRLEDLSGAMRSMICAAFFKRTGRAGRQHLHRDVPQGGRFHRARQNAPARRIRGELIQQLVFAIRRRSCESA